jgi:hypothetical protein
MADETNEQHAGGGSAGDQSQNGNQQGGGSANQSAAQDQTASANKLIKEFAKERGITVEDLLTQFKTLENANKTELQRLQDAAQSWERKYGETVTALQQERAERAVFQAASAANAVDPEAIVALAMPRVTFADGAPTNVAEVIGQLREANPKRFAAVAGSGDGGKGSGGTGSDPNAAINQAIRQLSGH